MVAFTAPVSLSIPSAQLPFSCRVQRNGGAHAFCKLTDHSEKPVSTPLPADHPLFAAASVATAAATAIMLLGVRPAHACQPAPVTRPDVLNVSDAHVPSPSSSSSASHPVLKVMSPPQDGLSASSATIPSAATPLQATMRAPTYQPHSLSVREWASPRRSFRAPRYVRIPPTIVGLVSVGAVTSGSVLLRRARRHTRPSASDTGAGMDGTSPLPGNVCTVVSVQIPFCVSDRAVLLERLDRLTVTESCRDGAGMARACRAAAAILLSEGGVMEDSRRFAPHVDLFLAESIEEAEKRFGAHVTIEGGRLDRLRSRSSVNGQEADYGVVTMVVATTEGVDLRCYSDDMTNLGRLTSALDAISRLREGEAAGLELLFVPQELGGSALTRAQMVDAFPSLLIA